MHVYTAAVCLTSDTFLYAGTAANWQDGIRQYIENLQQWQTHVVDNVDSEFPVRDLSSLLQDIGEKYM